MWAAVLKAGMEPLRPHCRTKGQISQCARLLESLFSDSFYIGEKMENQRFGDDHDTLNGKLEFESKPSAFILLP